MDIAPLAVSISEAARITGLGRTLLYREITEGRLRIRKAGTRTLVETRELERFIEALPTATAAPTRLNTSGKRKLTS